MMKYMKQALKALVSSTFVKKSLVHVQQHETLLTMLLWGQLGIAKAGFLISGIVLAGSSDQRHPGRSLQCRLRG